jgi:murein hydrolase activator
MKKLIGYISVLVFVIPQIVFGQDRTQLERERKQIQSELKAIQGEYAAVKGKTKQSMTQLSLINRKLEVQEQYLGNINKELRAIDDEIYLSELEIYRLNKQLDTLKTQYAKTVVYAYKNRSNYDYLNFIFSANSFNDAIKRVSYLKSYRAYREKQVDIIKQTQQLIAQRKNQQLGRKEEKNVALVNQTEQTKELEGQKNEKAAVVAKLKSQENDLAKQVADKKKRDAKLKNQIMSIIERERVAALEAERKRKKAEEEERKRLEADRKKADAIAKANTKNNTSTTTPKTTTPTVEPKVVVIPDKKTTAAKTYVPLNAAETNLAASFAANRGKLPWPVDNGVVCSNFGVNAIEGTKLTEKNDGITICLPNAGVPVKSIFDGEVLSVFDMGDGMAVMIKHGNYYTVYSNLSSAGISTGAKVARGQVIGRAGSDEEGGGSIDLILMQDNRNINPRPWLR